MNMHIDPKLRLAEWDRIHAADHQRRDRDAVERRKRDDDLARVSTAPTRNRLRRDVVQVLHDRGELGEEQRQAGEEIARVWEAITRGLNAHVSNYEAGARGGEPNMDWRPRLVRAYRERYCPWRADASMRVILRRRVTVGSLALLIAAENHGVSQVGQALGMDERRVKRLLQQALFRYAELAGWITQPQAAATYAGSIQAAA